MEVEQRLLVHPCGRGWVGGHRYTHVDEIAHRPLARGGAGVERAPDVVLAEVEQPRREVTGVDELQRTLAWRGHDGARRSIAQQPRVHEACDPVAEAVGGVVRTDDQARPHDRRTGAEGVAHDRLAGGLECAVIGQHVFGRGIVDCGDGRRLVEPGPIGLGDDRQRRHEHVAAHARREPRGGRADHARHVARSVDHRIPLAALQSGKPGRDTRVAVADEGLDAIAERLRRAAAREQRHLVPARERFLRHVSAKETRPSEQQQSHGRSALQPRAAMRRSSSACSAASPQASTSPPFWQSPPCQSVTTPPAPSITGISAWMS